MSKNVYDLGFAYYTHNSIYTFCMVTIICEYVLDLSEFTCFLLPGFLTKIDNIPFHEENY